MKKNYFMLAATAALFAACAETDLVNEINVTESVKQEAISFESFTNKTTRAEIVDETALQTEGGFKVWGYKTSQNNYTVFNGVNVYWVAQNGDVAAHWGYSDTQYWDETATYNFYAVAPNDNNSSISNGLISITGVASDISTNSKDYLIDRAGNTGVAGSDKQTQNFDFNHIMAKLSFVLKAGVAENITVTDLKISGWNSNAGTFTQSLTETPTGNTLREWSQTAGTAGTFTLVGDDASDETLPLTADMAAVNVTDKYIMVPQTITYVPYAAAVKDNSGQTITEEVLESGLTFTISYTIGLEEFTNQVGIVPSNQTWGTDTHTTYTITVGPKAIEFDVSSVAGFTNNTLTGSATIQ